MQSRPKVGDAKARERRSGVHLQELQKAATGGDERDPIRPLEQQRVHDDGDEAGDESRAELARVVDINLHRWKFPRKILPVLALDLGNSAENCRSRCQMSGFCCRSASFPGLRKACGQIALACYYFAVQHCNCEGLIQRNRSREHQKSRPAMAQKAQCFRLLAVRMTAFGQLAAPQQGLQPNRLFLRCNITSGSKEK